MLMTFTSSSVGNYIILLFMVGLGVFTLYSGLFIDNPLYLRLLDTAAGGVLIYFGITYFRNH